MMVRSAKPDMDWQAYVKITLREYIKRYAECAKENTQDANVLKTELDNILEAANRAKEERLYEVPLEIAHWLWIDGGRFLDLQGYIVAGIQLLTQALDAARLLNNKAQEEELLGQMGRVWLAARDPIKASQYFHEALNLAEEIDDQRGQASHLGCLGQIYLDQRNIQNAEECFQQALTFAKEIADRQLEGRLLGSLGLLSADKRDYSEAIKYYERAISIAEDEKDWQGKASHLGGMGTAYQFLGLQSVSEKSYVSNSAGETSDSKLYEYPGDDYYSQAKRCFEQALDIAEKLEDKEKKEEYKTNLKEVQKDNSRSQAGYLGCLGQIYLDQRNTQNAEKCFQQALKLAKEIADRQLEGRLLGSLGLLSAGKRDYFEAIKYYERAISIAEEEKDWQGKASHLGGMGTAYQILGLQSVPEKSYVSNSAGEMSDFKLYEYPGDTRKRDGYYSQAKRCFEQAIDIAGKMGDKEKKKEYKTNLKEVQRLEKIKEQVDTGEQSVFNTSENEKVPKKWWQLWK